MISEFLQPDFRENAPALEVALCLLIVATGYLLTAAIGALGLAQRGLLKQAGVSGFCTPLHWLLLSIAAWWAALELVYAPFRWRKTEHGLDKASRQESTMRSLLELERLSHGFEAERGELPQILERPKDSAVKSAAASSGRRFRLNGATKRPCLSIR